MKISPKTQVDTLLKEYQFLDKFFENYGPDSKTFRSVTARAALASSTNLRTIAAIGGVDLDIFMEDLARQIHGASGDSLPIAGFGRKHFKESAVRMETVKKCFLALKNGKDIDAAKKTLFELADLIEPHEIAAVEHNLVREGITLKELQKLCDLHLGSTCDILGIKSDIEVLSGHPVNTYIQENEKIVSLAKLLKRLGKELDEAKAPSDEKRSVEEIKKAIENLKGVEIHYIRKENHLFPPFERHGLTEPPHVTWEIHDEIRHTLKKARDAAGQNNLARLRSIIPELGNSLIDMVETENRIVFPLALNTLTSNEWRRIRQRDDMLSYDFVMPGSEWPKELSGDSQERSPYHFSRASDQDIELDTGKLTREQFNLIFNHLTVDVSYIDEYDEVRYYNKGDNRIFARAPQSIGRKVQSCHPIKSLHLVNRILSEFRRGTKDSAEFWYEIKGKFVHVQYIATRDEEGAYRGCLEVSQDATNLRKLEGTSRLLDWNKEE